MPTDKYNPNAPQIIGNEFLGIRDEDLTFDPFANTFEKGFEFQFSTGQTVNSVRAYLNTFPEKFFRYGCMTASIYPQGTEDQSGPVQSVIIPCNNGIVTGDSGGGGFSAISFGGGATSAASALWNPSGLQYMSIRVGELYRSAASLFFAVNQYQPILSGKRILGIDFLTTVDIGSLPINGGNDQGTIFLFMDNNAGIILNDGASSTGSVLYARLAGPTTPTTTVAFVRVHLGDVSRYYGITTGSVVGNSDCQQWTYPELQRFEMSHANRLSMRITTPPVGVDSGSIDVLISYAALEVFYCEESRVGFGTTVFQDTTQAASVPLRLGATDIEVMTSAGSAVTVSPGNYSVTLSQSNLGDAVTSLVSPLVGAKFNALLTKNEPIAPQVIPGVQVNLPYPLNEEIIGTTLTAERTMTLPQLSLHSTTATLVQSHVYGRQSVAQVYSTSTPAFVMQGVYSALTQTTRTYDWLRVWVRRFGDTTGSLKVNITSSTSGPYTDSITVAELDQLPEIIDGWRAVDFDFTATPVTISASSTVNVTFTSQPTLAAGNRWELLGCVAPAISGLPGNELNVVLSPNDLSLSTYGAPVSGAVIAETWLPWLGPYPVAMVLSGAVGSYAATADNAALDITGDIDLRFDAAATDWSSGSTQSLISKWGASPQRSYLMNSTATGFLTLSWSVDGTAVTTRTSTVAIPDTQANRIAVRATLDVNDGAGNHVVTFYTAPTMNGIWTQLGTAVTTAGVTSIFSGTLFVEVGAHTGGTSSLFGGAIYSIKILNGISGTEVANPNFAAQPAGTGGTAAFTDAAGRVWNTATTAPIQGVAASLDPTADLTFMFSQTQPAVTGFAISTESQAITGIGESCGSVPCCIPTGLLYNELTWGLPVNTGYRLDEFTRTAASSWGNATSGQAWSAPVGGAASQASVSNGTGFFSPDTVSAFRYMIQSSVGSDFDITSTMWLNSDATSQTSFGLVGRYTDANNVYEARVAVLTTGFASLSVDKTVSGSFSLLNTIFLPFNVAESAYGKLKLRFTGYGPYLKAKVWNINEPEPDHWSVEATDTSLTTGSGVGYVFLEQASPGGNTFGVDDFVVTPPANYFGYYELQRMDTVETDWHTIMKCTDPSITSFNDYEARIGIVSSYRIRQVDLYEFPSPWSTTLTHELDDPGIEGGDCVLEGHILVFTSNEHQDGAVNLAYASVWMDQQVTEDFRFPEANFVQLQTMYDKNFFTAFRPTERGGEAFTRTLLVQAAAIAPETLADFRSLRDMAWDSVNYICVRDEDGNRWFATVLVPDGRVLRDRRLYLASVGITEVTDTPTPVDPAA